MNSEASQLRDQDLVQWIENKLGDPNELWSGRQASSLLTKPMIIELETCFQALEPHVKLKIIQAVLHLSPRLVQLWREPLTNLLNLARRDADDWVETVADMYRDFPVRGCIRCTPSNPDSFFYKTLEELHRILKERIERTPSAAPSILPPDCALLSHSAIAARYGFSKVEPKAHFSLNKTSKSQQLLEEVEKAAELQNNPLHKKNTGGVISSFPIKMRSTARKPNNNLPMRGIPSVNTNKISGGFTNEPKKFQRQLAKREGGAMLIDIAELPQLQMGAGRRRKNPAEAAPQKGGKKTAENGATAESAPPKRGRSAKTTKVSAAANNPSPQELIDDEDEKRTIDSAQDQVEEAPNFVAASSSSSQLDTPPSTAPSSAEIVDENNSVASSQQFGSPPVINGMYMPSSEKFLRHNINNNNDARYANNVAERPSVSGESHFASPQFSGDAVSSTASNGGGGGSGHSMAMMSGVDGQPPPSTLSSMSPNSQHMRDNSAGISDATTKQLKELLKDANKLTPVSYNLIAAFLSGNRTNPLQNKLGAVVTLLLSELIEYDQSLDGRTQAHLVETFFQMDYRTGEWKRLRKSRLLRVDEVAALQSGAPPPSAQPSANYAAVAVPQPTPMYGGGGGGMMSASMQNPSYATNPPPAAASFQGGGMPSPTDNMLFPSSHFGFH